MAKSLVSVRHRVGLELKAQLFFILLKPSAFLSPNDEVVTMMHFVFIVYQRVNRFFKHDLFVTSVDYHHHLWQLKLWKIRIVKIFELLSAIIFNLYFSIIVCLVSLSLL